MGGGRRKVFDETWAKENRHGVWEPGRFGTLKASTFNTGSGVGGEGTPPSRIHSWLAACGPLGRAVVLPQPNSDV